MSWEPTDHRPVYRRIEIGAQPPPRKSREEIAAAERADRDMQAIRLRESEALWQTVVEAAGGSAVSPKTVEIDYDLLF